MRHYTIAEDGCWWMKILLVCSLSKIVLGEEPYIYEASVTKECSEFTWGVSSSIRTPNYPESYPGDIDCRKILKAGPHFRVILRFLDFQLEGSIECRYDSIEIRDGPFGFSPLIFRGCGTDVRIGHVIQASGKYMWLRFLSDSVIQARGFRAEISAAPANTNGSSQEAPAIVPDCYTIIEKVEKFRVSSDNLPDSMNSYYEANPKAAVNCVWDIRMETNMKTLVRFTEYEGHPTIDCSAGFLALYDMSSAEADVRIKSCTIQPGLFWTSGDQRVLLRVYAKGISVLPEFTIDGNIYIKEENCSSKGMFDCHDGYCIPENLVCDGIAQCAESYDEDCSTKGGQKLIQTQYVTLLIIVVVGSLLLVTVMTLAEAIQKGALKEKRMKESIRPTSTCSSITGTFRSKYNENVSFRSRGTPNRSLTTNLMERERIYQTPHCSLPEPQIDRSKPSLHGDDEVDNDSLSSNISGDRLLEMISGTNSLEGGSRRTSNQGSVRTSSIHTASVHTASIHTPSIHTTASANSSLVDRDEYDPLLMTVQSAEARTSDILHSWRLDEWGDNPDITAASKQLSAYISNQQ